jgi:hypothetical protein
MKIKILMPILMVLLISGCFSNIDSSINNYRDVRYKISIGDNKAQVISLLGSAQEDLDYRYQKDSDQYIDIDDIATEIYYARSGWQKDGLITDNEFTPYVFKNDKLVSIGWEAIGGQKIIAEKTVYYFSPGESNYENSDSNSGISRDELNDALAAQTREIQRQQMTHDLIYNWKPLGTR